MEKKEIYIFIVEDMSLARQMIKEHFEKGKITYAEVMDADKREKVTQALELIAD